VRRALPIAVVVALLGIGFAVPSAPARSCGTARAPGYHVIITSVKGTSCSRARRIIQSWIDDKAKPSSGPSGWRCRAKYGRQLWRCTRGDDVVRFTRHTSGYGT
jgi:hypothetical protein